MIKMISHTIMVSALILGLAACGYQQGQEGNTGTSTKEVGDNREEYLIKNRTDENDYLDMNTNPNMDTRASDEKLKPKSKTSIQNAQYNLEQTMRQKVLQLKGVQSAEVSVMGKQANIRFRPANESDAQHLTQQIKDIIGKQFAYRVNVTTY